MTKLNPPNLTAIIITSSGTGPFTAGPAAPGYFDESGLVDGASYGYSVQQGANAEVGYVTWNVSSGTFTRSVLKSTYGNGPVPFQANAILNLSMLKEDFDALGVGSVTEAPSDGQTYGRNDRAWEALFLLPEAPVDSHGYMRKAADWVELPDVPPSGGPYILEDGVFSLLTEAQLAALVFADSLTVNLDDNTQFQLKESVGLFSSVSSGSSYRFNDDGQGWWNYILGGRGTKAAPAAIQNGDYISVDARAAYDGTNNIFAGVSFWNVDGVVSTGNVPTAWNVEGEGGQISLRASGNFTASGAMMIGGPLSTTQVTSVTTSGYTVLPSDTCLSINGVDTVLVLPSGVNPETGRGGIELVIKTITGNSAQSSASDIIPLLGGSLVTSILPAIAGSWARIKSNDAGNWEIIEQFTPSSAGTGSSFSTIASLEATNVNSGISTVILSGYYAPGDGGGATYIKSDVAGPALGLVQSADGQWWKLGVQVLNVLMFGAVPNIIGDAAINDAAFTNMHDYLGTTEKGGLLTVPNGTFYKSATWEITKRLTFIGTNAGDQPTTSACQIFMTTDVDAIAVYSETNSPNGNGADQTILERFEINGANGTVGRGIYSSTAVKIRDCIVRTCGGAGIEIDGETGVTGIADFWNIQNCRVVNNKGDGLKVHGSDSQVGTAIGLECIANGGFGINDTSAYGNTYIGCQSSGNTGGDWNIITSTTYYGSLLLNCYTEFGGAANNFDDNCIIIGGVLHGATGASNGSIFAYMYPGVLGVNLGGANGFSIFVKGTEMIRLNKTGGIELSDSVSFMGGNATTYSAGLASIASNTNSAVDQMRFNVPLGRAGSITTTGLTTAYVTTSDYRLKNNVALMDEECGLKTVNKLRPVIYDWIDSGDYGEGFIAHELQEHIPIAVTGEKDAVDEEGNAVYQGIDLAKIVPALVKAVQELSAELDALKAQQIG